METIEERPIIFIESPNEIESNKDFLDSFFNIYIETFEGYAENTDKIKKRILTNVAPNTTIGIYKENMEVIGGVIFEKYQNGEVVLLTYIFVREGFRKEGRAKKILSYLKEKINPVKLVVFEGLLEKQDYNIVKSDIFEVFKNLQSYHLDIDYVEPVSNERNHILCVLNLENSTINIKEQIKFEKIKYFLEEFYFSNKNSGKFPISIDFENSVDYNIKDKVFLKETTEINFRDKFNKLPKSVKPKLEFNRASVALHFVQDIQNEAELCNNIDGEIPNKKKLTPFCKVFNSFENDLFSLKYIDDQPYYSKNLKTISANIQFQNHFEFISEGRSEHFILVNDNEKPLLQHELNKKINIFINYTYFRNAKILVWHFVIFPLDPLNEYELIQLTKLYTGKQENFIPRLLIDGYDLGIYFNDLISKIVSEVYQVEVNSSSLVVESEAGTLQVDTFMPSNFECRDEAEINKYRNRLPFLKFDDKKNEKNNLTTSEGFWTWNEIYQYFNSDDKKNENKIDILFDIYRKNDDARYILNTMCGLSLGIFDYDRMTFEEVADTITPLTTTDSYFVQLNKNAINCFCLDNKIYETGIEQGIGINPYLIIPNSVLAYNSYISTQAYQRVKDLKNEISLKELSEVIEKLSNFTKIEIRNVFQYETEISLYDEGMKKRGMIEKNEEIKRQLDSLEIKQGELKEKRNLYLTSIGIALSIISLTQVFEFVKKLLEDKINSIDFILGIWDFKLNNDSKLFLFTNLPWMVTLIVTMVFVILFDYAINDKPKWESFWKIMLSL